MGQRKKNISQVTDLTDNPRSLDLLAPSFNLVPQAPKLLDLARNDRLQVTTQPPMATWRTTSSRLQHRPLQSMETGDQLRSTPGPVSPVLPWQGGPSTSPHNSATNTKQVDPRNTIRRSAKGPAAVVRDVRRAAGEPPDQSGLNSRLAGLRSPSPEVAGPSTLSTLGPGQVHLDPVRPRGSRSANMTPVSGLTTVLPERRLRYSSLEPAQVEASSSPRWGPRQQVAVLPDPSPFRNASKPGPEGRKFSVVIASSPKVSTPKPLAFGLTESDEKPASKDSRKSTPQRGRPKRTPASKVSNQPALTPQANGMSGESQYAPATKSVSKKRGGRFKTPEKVTKDTAPKKRSRPYELPKDFDTEIELPPAVYNPFLCEWEGCPAKLVNLEVLRNHVFHVHNQKLPSGARQCLWGKCSPAHDALHDKDNALGGSNTPVEYKTKAEWHDHINKTHLVPVAWRMGDGPQMTPLDVEYYTKPKSLPRWLFDENGNQVTPSVEGQPIEEGSPRENNLRRFKKTRVGLHVVYERVNDPALYWKMPDDPDYFQVSEKKEDKMGEP